MAARVLVLGLDACDAGLLEDWSANEGLPAVARLRREGRAVRLSTCLGTLPGAIWPELETGRSCGRDALFYHPGQIRSGEARARPLRVSEINPEYYYWTVAARHGLRVAVVDQVHSVPAPGVDGAQLLEWGTHDRTFGTLSEPPELLTDLDRRYGRHPVRSCDRHGGTDEGLRRLLSGLIEGARTKIAFAGDLVRSARWDLAAITFSESHCAGHQFWHLQDPDHPRFRPDAPAELRGAIRTAYAVIDEAIAHLREAAGPDATVFVVASHGMGRRNAGPLLLPEFLARLGLAAGGTGTVSSAMRRGVDAGRILPASAKAGLRWVARRTGIAAAAIDPFTSPGTRAAAVDNNRCGAIRLNLRGREPQGAVGAGDEATTILGQVRDELMRLRHPSLGVPIVERVLRATEAFGPDHHADVPDLIVVFRGDLGALAAAVSPTLGAIRAPAGWLATPRTGAHTPESRLWMAGPGVEAGSGEGCALDLAPTVLASLGVPRPGWLDGRTLPPFASV